MRIGIVSDTHNNIKNVKKVIELFNNFKVEKVIHTGDITQPKVLSQFKDLQAQLYGVFGNNDQERAGLEHEIKARGFFFQDPPLLLTWNAREIIVVHDPLEFEGHLNGQDLAIHGHTHRYRMEKVDGTLFFNPGESAGMMEGRNAIGIVDLETISAEIQLF